jgi:hypothetical protein
MKPFGPNWNALTRVPVGLLRIFLSPEQSATSAAVIVVKR